MGLLGLSDQAVTALIGGGAALVGGLVGGLTAYWVERLKLRQTSSDKAAETLAEAAAAYVTAIRHWLAWSEHLAEKRPEMIDEQWDTARKENNLRVRARDEAEVRLRLLCSRDLETWISKTFVPLCTAYLRLADEAIEERTGVTDELVRAAIEVQRGWGELIRRLRTDIAP